MTKFPSLKQLHYLITLYETRHFGEAAKRCFVSQSTLSAGIQNLEDLMNVQLIERDNKTLVFSVAGEEVVLRSRDILAASQDLMEIAQQNENDMEGKLRLGCIPTIAPFLLSELVQCVNLQFPYLNLLLREDTTANLLAALKNGELDLAILAMPVDIQGMECEIVGRDYFKMVFSKEQAVKLNTPLTYSDLPNASVFLLEREHCLTDHAVSACQLTTSEKINSFSATSLHTLVNMVANGLGSTFLPQMAIKHGLIENLNLSLVQPPGNEAFREIGVIWRPSSCRKMTYRQLAEVVKALL